MPVPELPSDVICGVEAELVVIVQLVDDGGKVLNANFRVVPDGPYLALLMETPPPATPHERRLSARVARDGRCSKTATTPPASAMTPSTIQPRS
jgi:hypothetical protein